MSAASDVYKRQTFTQSGCSGTVTTSNGQETLTSTFKVSGSGDNAKIWSDDAAGGWSSGDSFDGTSMEIIASDNTWEAVLNCGEQLGRCNVCTSGVVDRTLLAGYWCADASEASLGDSNDGNTQDECLNAGGTWKPYTCGDV